MTAPIQAVPSIQDAAPGKRVPPPAIHPAPTGKPPTVSRTTHTGGAKRPKQAHRSS